MRAVIVLFLCSMKFIVLYMDKLCYYRAVKIRVLSMDFNLLSSRGLVSFDIR